MLNKKIYIPTVFLEKKYTILIINSNFANLFYNKSLKLKIIECLKMSIH